MNFSGSKQTIKPPQRGIFPLDHESECKPYMEVKSFVSSSVLDCHTLENLNALFPSPQIDAYLRHTWTSKYISCLKDQQDKHYLCRELSKEYLQCRMDRQLMASEDLDKLGFSEDAKVEKAVEYDKSKEKEGYVAGKHIDGRTKWWFQKLW
ncbi:hypothetical protein ACHAWU_005425 [Discostella pseudostelligera]|uniref:NADH dehydrogenase [ubiquinone] 1 beta subcomplex subunit 7 n=1 Tax=Discostella pseudostelligera TaxID=259834 RepID=A0ABD3MW92_9STRA